MSEAEPWSWHASRPPIRILRRHTCRWRFSSGSWGFSRAVLASNDFTSPCPKCHSFKSKQFVRWKEGLQNRSRPAYGEPAIVWQILPQALMDEEKGTGSPYFREPLDMVLGVLGDNGEFILFHYDSRRFEPFPE